MGYKNKKNGKMGKKGECHWKMFALPAIFRFSSSSTPGHTDRPRPPFISPTKSAHKSRAPVCGYWWAAERLPKTFKLKFLYIYIGLYVCVYKTYTHGYARVEVGERATKVGEQKISWPPMALTVMGLGYKARWAGPSTWAGPCKPFSTLWWRQQKFIACF